MTDPDPWGYEPTAEERAAWARRDAAASDHNYQVPARDAAERAAYDQIEQAERLAGKAHQRDVHFNGHYPTDPYIEHGEHCVDFCPYDTGEQARLAWAEHADPEAGA